MAFVFLVFQDDTRAQNDGKMKPIEKQIQQIEEEIGFEKMVLFEEAELKESRSIDDENLVLSRFELKSNAFLRLQNEKEETVSFDLVIDNELLKINLVKHEILSNDFVITMQTDDGKQTVTVPTAIYFKGMIAGESNSLVTLSVFEKEVICHIHRNGLDYVVQKNPNEINRASEDFSKDYVLVNEANLDLGEDFSCGVEDDQVIVNPTPDPSGVFDPNKCVRVYVECDHQMYLDNNSDVTTLTNFVTAVFNQVFTIYQNENINMVISEINIWAVPDPYPTNSTLSSLLAFRDNLAGNYNGDIAQLLATGITGKGGIAYVNQLCNNYYACGVNSIFNSYSTYPVYSPTVMIIAHEMGHNLGSKHTHACVWNGNNTAIDGCGPQAGYSEGCTAPLPSAGTIMSYCHLISGVGIDFTQGFGPQPGALIRDRVYNSACLTACGPVCPSNETVLNSISQSNLKYEVHNTIDAYNVILPSAQNIIYDAGDEINLLPDFEAQEGCDFLALIEGCGGAFKSQEPDLRFGEIGDESEIQLTNYPNPFSDRTTIAFSLPETENVQLSIFDTNGKELIKLIDNEKYDKGRHQIEVDGGELNAGVYYYTLRTGKEIVGEKLMILK